LRLEREQLLDLRAKLWFIAAHRLQKLVAAFFRLLQCSLQ
jgi:hypothetical protein